MAERKAVFHAQLYLKLNRMEGMIGGILLILTLDQVCLGRWCRVTAVDTDKNLRRRLRDFGFAPGTQVRRRYTSPGCDLSAVELRGSVVALRASDLQHIWVCL